MVHKRKRVNRVASEEVIIEKTSIALLKNFVRFNAKWEDVLTQCVTDLRTHTGSTRVTIRFFSQEANSMLVGVHADPLGVTETMESIDLRSKANNFYQKLSISKRAIVQEGTAIQFFPMWVDDTYIGFVSFEHPRSGKKDLAHFVGIIGRGLKVIQDSIRQQLDMKKLRKISSIASEMTAAMKTGSIIELIIRSVVELLGFDSVKLLLVDRENNLLRAGYRYDMLNGGRVEADETYPLVFRNDEPVNAMEQENFLILKDDTWACPLLHFHSLRVKDTVIGFVAVNNFLSREPITRENKNYLQIFMDQASIALENARLYRRVEELSIRDELTGLYNTRFFRSEVRKEIIRLKRYQSDLSLILLDLDHFKQINDTYGHLAGDEVLKNAAKIILQCIRDNDIAARYGGDEFPVLLLYTDVSAAEVIAERIRLTIAESPIVWQGQEIRYTCSIGVTCTRDAELSEDLFFDRADKALYVSKNGGRNKVNLGS